MKCVQQHRYGNSDHADYVFLGLSLCRSHFNEAVGFVSPTGTTLELLKGYSRAVWAMLNIEEERRRATDNDRK